LNGNLASAEKCSGPLRFLLRQVLLYMDADLRHISTELSQKPPSKPNHISQQDPLPRELVKKRLKEWGVSIRYRRRVEAVDRYRPSLPG
jgi:hypothetical protein